MEQCVAKLQQMIDDSHRIVFFGGAGVSTESGIPDFRSVDGLYSQKFDYPPETILSHSFFVSHTAEFYDFYRQKMISLTAKPNAAHRKLVELETAGKLSAIVTQKMLFRRRNSFIYRNSPLFLRRPYQAGCCTLRRTIRQQYH